MTIPRDSDSVTLSIYVVLCGVWTSVVITNWLLKGLLQQVGLCRHHSLVTFKFLAQSIVQCELGVRQDHRVYKSLVVPVVD